MTRQNQIFIGGWTDKDYDFLESVEHGYERECFARIQRLKWFGTRWGYNLENTMFVWLRVPENMTTFYNTVERIGFENFFTKEEYNTILFDYGERNDWKGMTLNEICNNLIASYRDTVNLEKYYKEFWERRQVEQNAQNVFEILCKIDRFYSEETIEEYKATGNIDTTLFNLLTFNIKLNNSDSIQSKKIITEYFDYLTSIGLNHSAYNLIFEIREYQNISVNRDSLLTVLQPDTLSEEIYWRTRNNAKWILSHRDNGP